MRRLPRQLKQPDLINQIEKLLSKNTRSRFNKKQIARKINVANPPASIQQALDILIDGNKVKQISNDRYRWNLPDSKKKSKNNGGDEILYTGVVDMTRSGAAYIIDSESVEDIYIRAKNLNGALHKDEVTVAVQEGYSRRRPEGRVISIEHRALSRIIGQIRRFKNYSIVTPENNRLYPEVQIKNDEAMDALDNDRVVVEITSYGRAQNKSLWGKVIKILENLSDLDLTAQSILYSNGFDPEFPENVLREVTTFPNKISEKEIAVRRDFRDITTFTIDPETAKDFDDALSVNFLDDGHIEVGVHIADVSHYITEKTLTDKEAYKRSTSVYLVDRVSPMLPEKLSNDLCSLNPNEDKLTFSAVFVFDKSMNITSEWFGRTVIHSNRRFTYEEVQNTIETDEGEFKKEIQTLNKIAHHLRDERYKNGSISFESDEVRFELDDEGLPAGLSVIKREDAHKLIEDFMLLANKQVATYIAKKAKPDIPFIYRVHDLPDTEKLSDFALFAKELGYHFKLGKPDQISKSFNQLAIDAEKDPLLKLLEPLAIRTMAKAAYSTENIGHYGLGFEYYTHFTSPIRRYSDILVHRILFQNLDSIHRRDPSTLEQKAKYISAQEISAVQAERESTKYFQTLYISKYVGEEFDGVISGIIEKGLFVQLPDSKVEGMVTFDSMDDTFMVPTNRLRAKSRITGEEFTMGQSIRVKIISADPETRRVDMALVE